MMLSGESNTERVTQIDALGIMLSRHQAQLSIIYLYDHGWQVSLSNPGGMAYVHAAEGDDKWNATPAAPSLTDTIFAAVEKAKEGGWW